MRGLTRDTIVELVDRKFIWLFGIITLFVCGIIVLIGQSDFEMKIQTQGDIEPMQTMQGLLDNAVVQSLESYSGFLLFLAMVATAGLLPRMLERGRADFYMSKPLSRMGLLYGKLGAVWLIYGLMLVICMGIPAVLTQIIFGAPGLHIVYLLMVDMLLLAIWMSITSFMGVLSTSTVMAIVTAVVVYFVQLLLPLREGLYQIFQSSMLKGLLDGLYYVLPKTSQVSALAVNLVLQKEVESWMPLWSSLVFAAFLFVAAGVVIKRKDY